MKKIEKILLLKNEKNLIYTVYVIYDNFTSKKYSSSKELKKVTEKAISEFMKQEKMSKKDLVHNKKIVITRMSDKKTEEVKKILNEANSYHLGCCVEKTLANTSFVSSILSFLFNHFFVYEIPVANLFTISSLISFILPLYSESLTEFEDKYLEPEKQKKHLRKAISLITLSLISVIDIKNIPNITTLPYYYEIKNTDIEDTGNYENLTKEEYHKKAVDTIFNNLHNNPYLSEKNLNILLGLKEYYMENPYLDYNEVFQDMLTVRVYERYNLGSMIAGSHSEDKNIIYCYSNISSMLKYDDTIEHEAIHMTGSLENQILNEGMTSLLQTEYFCNGIQRDGYTREVLVTKALCEVIGSDTMLKAYSTENDSLIHQALLTIYRKEAKVDLIYQMMDIYVNSSDEDAPSVGKNFILLLIHGVPEEMEYDLTLRLLAIEEDKAYFSDNYETYLTERQKIKEQLRNY